MKKYTGMLMLLVLVLVSASTLVIGVMNVNDIYKRGTRVKQPVIDYHVGNCLLFNGDLVEPPVSTFTVKIEHVMKDGYLVRVTPANIYRAVTGYVLPKKLVNMLFERADCP